MAISLLLSGPNVQSVYPQGIYHPTPHRAIDAIPLLQPTIWAPEPAIQPKFDFYQDWTPVIGVSERSYPVRYLLSCKDALMSGENADRQWCFYYELGYIAREQGDNEMAI